MYSTQPKCSFFILPIINHENNFNGYICVERADSSWQFKTVKMSMFVYYDTMFSIQANNLVTLYWNIT